MVKLHTKKCPCHHFYSSLGDYVCLCTTVVSIFMHAFLKKRYISVMIRRYSLIVTESECMAIVLIKFPYYSQSRIHSIHEPYVIIPIVRFSNPFSVLLRVKICFSIATKHDNYRRYRGIILCNMYIILIVPLIFFLLLKHIVGKHPSSLLQIMTEAQYTESGSLKSLVVNNSTE